MINLTASGALPAQGSAVVSAENRCIEILIDASIGKLSLRFIGAQGKLSLDPANADGQALGDREYSTMSANQPIEIYVRRDRRTGTTALTKYYVTSATNGIRIEAFGEAGP